MKELSAILALVMVVSLITITTLAAKVGQLEQKLAVSDEVNNVVRVIYKDKCDKEIDAIVSKSDTCWPLPIRR